MRLIHFTRLRVLLLTVLLTGTALGGCMSAEDANDLADDVAPDAGDGATGTPTGGDDGGDDSGDDGTGDGEESGFAWNAYGFQEPVTASGEELGTLGGYTYHVYEEDWRRWSGPGAEADHKILVREWMDTVTYVGEQEEDVCAMRSTQIEDSYERKEEQIQVAMDVHHLEHRVEIMQDDRGDAEPGDVANITILIDAQTYEDESAGGFARWLFTAMRLEAPGYAGSWEMGSNASTAKDIENGDAYYAPCVKGEDPMDWWGFGNFAMIYGLNIFRPMMEGVVDLDRNTPPGWTVNETTFDVSGVTFEGYDVRVDMRGSVLHMIFSPGLPLPFLLESEREEDEGGKDVQRYELTDIALE